MLYNVIYRTILSHARPRIKLQLRYHGFLSSPFSTTPSNQHSFTLTYLINSCGLSPESAILASKDIDLSKSPIRADSVLAFLHNQGFTKTQVSKLICRHPKILSYDPENTLLPIYQTLSSTGFSNTVFAVLITARPKAFLTRRLKDTALSSVNYLRNVLGSEDKVIRAIKRFPLALTYDLQVYATENIQMLREIGVPESSIVAMLTHQPRTFLTSADRFRRVVSDVKEMGFDPSKAKFLWAIHAVRAMSKSTWEKKVELYKKWGWTEDEIFMAFEKCPGFMMAGPDKISRIMDFVVNTMGWERRFIVQWPIIICFSLEKRIIPRCMVYQYLAENGLTEENDDFSFNKWLMLSETQFLKWVMKKYEDESLELLKLYQKHLGEANG